jgi:hypothetical protein
MAAIEHSDPDTAIETGRIGGRGDRPDLYTVRANRPRFDANRQGFTIESHASMDIVTVTKTQGALPAV